MTPFDDLIDCIRLHIHTFYSNFGTSLDRFLDIAANLQLQVRAMLVEALFGYLRTARL